MKILKVNSDGRLELLEQMHRELFDAPLPKLDGVEQYWIHLTDDGKLIGFCGIRPSAQWQNTGYLLRAGVYPEFRGKGIQKQYIKLRIRYAKKQGWEWLITDARQNPASVNNLIACGFRMYSPSNPWSFKDATYWRRKI